MKWILIIASLLLALGLGVSDAYSQSMLNEKCVPCEQSSVELGLAGKSLGLVSNLRLPNGKYVAYSLLFNSLAMANTAGAQSNKSEDQLQFAGGCYYQFTGATFCSNHTMYGLYCLTGSWYCKLLGSCRTFAIGSCP